MIFIHKQELPADILVKLNNLCDLLQQAKDQFEALACDIPDRGLQRTLRKLALESCQYINELCAQIQCLGGEPNTAPLLLNNTATNTSISEAPYNTLPMDSEVFNACTQMERKMIMAYRNMLNEFELHADLRCMLRNQLNAIMCGYLQLKMMGYHHVNA